MPYPEVTRKLEAAARARHRNRIIRGMTPARESWRTRGRMSASGLSTLITLQEFQRHLYPKGETLKQWNLCKAAPVIHSALFKEAQAEEVDGWIQ